ncbi:probable G-protein coupled receptor 19 [Physella acuta]|uniref:probable G-protein coupled receptor 19 n=1 Tax=Physella acuta TaxID=109671 RepID=UPI0027DD5838|nr:probable G-protein coupled receptor 19 [Physella acuta]
MEDVDSMLPPSDCQNLTLFQVGFTSLTGMTSTMTTEQAADGSIRPAQVGLIIVLSVVFVPVWTAALVGNTLVLLVIRRSRRVQSTTNYFVTSIALSDVMFVTLAAPCVWVQLILQEWSMGHVVCRLVRFVQFSATCSTAWVLVAVCIDRFYTVLHPLSFKVTRGTAHRMIQAAWLLALLTSCLALYFFDLESAGVTSPRVVCPAYVPGRRWFGLLYAGVCLASHYAIPLAVLCVGYGRIFWHIRSLRGPGRPNIPVPRAKVKMVRRMWTLSGATLLLQLPYYAAHAAYSSSPTHVISPEVFLAAFWSILLSSALKPAMYACQNSNFLRGCKEVLCMSSMRCHRLNVYAVTSASTLSRRNYVGVIDQGLNAF